MPIGYPVNKVTLDNRAGSLVETLRNTFAGVKSLKDWLDAHPDAEVEAFGYTPGEVDIIKSAITDLDKLRRIAEGTEVQAAPSDFFFFADQLTGIV